MVEHRYDVVGEFKQDNDRTQNIDNRHKRHDELGDVGDAVYAADDNHAREDGEGDAHCQCRYVKGNGNGGGDGVCLRGVTDKAQRDNQGDGEKAR